MLLGTTDIKPRARPWVIFSDISTKPASVTGTTSPDSGYAKASSYWALDACNATADITSLRCGLQQQASFDTCATSSTLAQEAMALYCSSYATPPPFDNSNDPNTICLQDTPSAQCLQNPISNKYIFLPPGITATSIAAPDLPCYNLTCTAAEAIHDGWVVANHAPFTQTSYVETRVTLNQLEYQAPGQAFASRMKTCILHINDVPKPAITYKSCKKTTNYTKAILNDMISQGSAYTNASLRDYCHSNALATRSLSADYESENIFVDQYKLLPGDLPIADYQKMIKDIVFDVEDYIATRPPGTAAGMVCNQQIPSNLALCNFTISTRESRALIIAEKCEDAQVMDYCHSVGARLCEGRDNTHTYDKSKCDGIVAAAAIGCMFAAICPFCLLTSGACIAAVMTSEKSCYQGPTEFEKCMKEFDDLGTCRNKYNVKCWNYMYQRNLITSPCDPIPTMCPYNEKPKGQTLSWAQQYAEAGLPTTGFCPECVGTGCSAAKSTRIFAVEQAHTGLHTLTPSNAPSGSRLNIKARNLRLSLNNLNGLYQVQCGSSPTCAKPLQKPAFVRENLYACIDCLAAPPRQCVGEHRCRFDNNNVDFTTAFNSIKAQLQANLPPTAGIAPIWTPFLDPLNFTNYNPTPLNNGFNSMITNLGGQCKTNVPMPDPSKCQNDNTRRALWAHTQAQYRTQEGAMVPPLHTLTYKATSAQLLGTNIPAWETSRPDPPFLQALFDDAMCSKFNFDSMICLQQTTAIQTWNPITAGDFEIQEGCDTMAIAGGGRYTSSACNMLACPLRSDTYDNYNTFDGTNYVSVSKWSACKLRDRVASTHYTTPPSVPNNLCSKTPSRPTTCSSYQGALGSWAGAPVRSLYSYLQLTPTPTTLLTLSASKEPSSILRSITASQWDMGGHYIRMALNAQNLWISGLPLRSYASLQSATAMNATAWVGDWTKNRYLETNTIATNHPNPTSPPCATWACPLKRRFFQSGVSPTFRPWAPNPRRSEAAYGTTNHPTAPPAPLAASVLARHYSRDGMCVCSDPADCATAWAAASGPCSRIDSIVSLYDQTQRLSKALGSSLSCSSQTDWPYTGGYLRDGSYLPVQFTAPCPTLGRLPQFRYRYTNSKTTIPSSLTTFDDGGDCHMGRTTTTPTPIPPQCTLTAKNHTHATLDCAGIPMYLPRPTSPTVQVQLQNFNRTLCGDCDAPPAFFANNTPTMEPEISYGTPWRWSPSRLLARDIRFRLCGNDTNCPPTIGWNMGSFWSRMMDGTLFTNNPSSSLRGDFAEPGPDPVDPAWDQPWILCTKNSTLAECQGKMSKQEWQGGDRTTQCQAVKSQSNSNEATVDLTICNLDSRLNDLCILIQNARYKIFEANCQVTGQCRTSAFFYQPATYSISDSRFVRSTVAQFYNFTQDGSCPVLDLETQEIIASNQQTLQNCPAQDLEALKYAIQIARETLHFFVKVAYYCGIIGIDLISLVAARDINAVIKDILFYFNKIAHDFADFFSTIGDIIYKIVMETGKLGAFLKTLITTICEFLRDIFYGIIMPWICGMREILSMIFDMISSIIGTISDLTFGSMDGVADQINSARDSMRDAISCDAENPFKCDALFMNDGNMPSALPMPTRCWVGYQPSIGEQQGLGCTPSDTCMDDDGTLKACAACRGVASPYYGCDSLTKLCRSSSIQPPPVIQPRLEQFSQGGVQGVGSVYLIVVLHLLIPRPKPRIHTQFLPIPPPVHGPHDIPQTPRGRT